MKFNPRGEQPLSTIAVSTRFKYGDPVVVYFGTAGIIQNCRVIKIHSTDSAVSYDVEVKWKHIESADNYSKGVDLERLLTDRLYNLDSAVVFSPDDFEDAAAWIWMRKEIGRIYYDSGLRPMAMKGVGPEEFWKAEGLFLDAVAKLLKEKL